MLLGLYVHLIVHFIVVNGFSLFEWRKSNLNIVFVFFRFLHSQKEPSLPNFVNYQAVWTIEWTKWRTKKNIQSSKCSLCNKQNCLLEHWTHQINFNDYIISILSSLLCFALRCVALPWLLLPFYSEIRDQEIKNHKVNFEFCFELMRSILNNNTKISTWKRFHSCDVCVSVCVCMLVSTKLSKIFVLIWTIWIKTIVFLQSSMTWQQFTFCCFSLFFIFFLFLRHIVTIFATYTTKPICISNWFGSIFWKWCKIILFFVYGVFVSISFDWLTFSCATLIDFTQFNRFPVSSFYVCINIQNQEVEISLSVCEYWHQRCWNFYREITSIGCDAQCLCVCAVYSIVCTLWNFHYSELWSYLLLVSCVDFIQHFVYKHLCFVLLFAFEFHTHTHLFILLTRKWHENKRVSRDKNSTTGRYINRYRFNFQVAIPLDCVFAVKLLFSNIQMEKLRQENIQMFVIMHQSEMNSFIYYFFF